MIHFFILIVFILTSIDENSHINITNIKEFKSVFANGTDLNFNLENCDKVNIIYTPSCEIDVSIERDERQNLKIIMKNNEKLYIRFLSNDKLIQSICYSTEEIQLNMRYTLRTKIQMENLFEITALKIKFYLEDKSIKLKNKKYSKMMLSPASRPLTIIKNDTGEDKFTLNDYLELVIGTCSEFKINNFGDKLNLDFHGDMSYSSDYNINLQYVDDIFPFLDCGKYKMILYESCCYKIQFIKYSNDNINQINKDF